MKEQRSLVGTDKHRESPGERTHEAMFGPVEQKTLADRYAHSSALRALLQIIPGGLGSAIDTFMMTTISNIREARIRSFFDELDKHPGSFTEEMLSTEDFVHKFLVTMKAAINTRQRQKIEMFARFLANGAGDPIDDYELLLKTLDEMSLKELVILQLVEKTWSAGAWKSDALYEAAATEHGISKSETDSILAMLPRTGCYHPIYGSAFGPIGENERLTPFYYKLMGLVQQHIEEMK